MTKRPKTRSARALDWIQAYCVTPRGPERGKFVRLSEMERETVRKIYDHPEGVQPLPVKGRLAAFLALLNVCGPEAIARDKQQRRPQCAIDVFTVWASATPALREVLKHEGEHIVCPELGTKFPATA